MSVSDQLGLDENSELLNQAGQKWPAWVAAHPRLDVLIAEAEKLIALAQERRAALITAAVTGQLDVREAA